MDKETAERILIYLRSLRDTRRNDVKTAINITHRDILMDSVKDLDELIEVVEEDLNG